jgi:hypothetical protein
MEMIIATTTTTKGRLYVSAVTGAGKIAILGIAALQLLIACLDEIPPLAKARMI